MKPSPDRPARTLFGSGAAFFSMLKLLGAAFFLILAATGAGSAGSGGDNPEALSLQDAMRLAVLHNPAMREASSRVEMSAERVVQARSGFMPRLDLVGGYQRTTNPALAFSTKLNQGMITAQDFDPRQLNEPDPTDNYSGGLVAVWPVYDSGRTWYGTRQAEMLQKATDFALDRTRRQVIAQTVMAYSGLLTALDHLEIVRQTRATAGANLRMVESRYQSGFVVKSDLLRTQVHVSDIEQQLFDAESQVEIARARLNDVLGVAIERHFEPVDKLEAGAAVTGSLEQWVDTALQQRADFKAVEYQSAVAETEVKKTRAAYLPSVNLTGNYQLNTEDFDGSADSYTIGAFVNLNLFSGLETSSRVRESLAALQAVRAARRRLEQQIRVETRQAYLEAQSAWKRISVATKAMQQAAEALRIVSSRYQNGLLTILDLLNSELALQQADTRHLYALHDFHVARARLLLAAGELDENFK